MGGADLQAENATLRARLHRLTEAILRISGDLDLDTVLQEIVECARYLTDTGYGAITTIDDSGALQDTVFSGLTDDEKERLFNAPQGYALFQRLTGFREPVRTGDLSALLRQMGFPEAYLPTRTVLGMRILDRDKHLGNIYIGEKEGGLDFTQEDEETLQMFAAQAAMAVTNARRYGAAQRAKADLEALVNTSPIGVLVLDAGSGDVQMVNPEARRILAGTAWPDVPLQDLLSTVTLRRLDGGTIPRDEQPLERAISAGETARAEEIVIHLPNGESVTTLINTTPIYSEEGEIISVVATIQDISPLEEVERLRAEFLGMVSHELRAPLTSIKGSAATVLGSSSPLDPAETRQFFRIIEERADHMRDLINNLLDLTRIEAGTLSVNPEPLDIGPVIDQARNAFLSGGYRNNIEVELVPDLPRVGGDPHRIIQVLHNLLANASRYSREWSSIRVSASFQDPYVAITVADDGQGITPERLPSLFNKFSGNDTGGPEQQVAGYGLGLSICRGIVEAHGGRIWAESEGLGRGTTFTFTIPTADGAGQSSRRAPDEEDREGEQGTERILVVDDDPQILRYVRHILSEAGYTPVLTGNPEEMEHLIEDEQPALVLLNLVLPGTNGFRLMERIPNTSEVPVIFMSGRGRGQDIGTAFEMGAADYVVKPFSPTELLARVKAALRKRLLFMQTHLLEPFVLGDLVIDYVKSNVTVAGQMAQLTPTEYKLLFELSVNAGHALGYGQLSRRVWGEGHPEDRGLLRSFVKGIRQKLGDDARYPSYLFTEPGIGYRLGNPLSQR